MYSVDLTQAFNSKTKKYNSIAKETIYRYQHHNNSKEIKYE